MSLSQRIAAAASACIIPLIFCISAQAGGVQFQPVSQEELKMTSEPQAPGAPAIILYRELSRDDCGATCHSANVGFMSVDRFEENYYRIKILTEAGREYGNVEIPLLGEIGSVGNIHARTIEPDGTVINLSGEVFEKALHKAKGLNYVAKTFTMPNVQVGSVLEYYYTINLVKGNYLFFSHWVLSNQLFTRRAKFALRPFQSDYGYQLSFRWNEHLPAGMLSPKMHNDRLELEAANIAAFQPEDYMPPQDDLKARVDFIYSNDAFEADASKFWKRVGKDRYDKVEKFAGKRGAMEQAVSQIVSPSDPPETKLRKLYSRVQQLRNLSYEARKTEQEEQRDKASDNQNVEDVWKRGAGKSWELTWLYLAFVRAAGVEAYAVIAADRNNHLFNPQSMESGKLESTLVLAKLDGKDLFLDPGTAFTPFGLLPWQESAVPGLKLDKDGGAWVQTSLPESSASRIERKATLTLSPTGDLGGKLTVTFTGLEAQRRRVEERNEDAAARKKFLEDEVKEYLPAEVELTKQPEWTSSDLPFVADFDIKVPGWAAITGKRAVLPIGLFGGSEKHVFEHASRTYPVYFEMLYQELDDDTVALPAGWQVASMPKAQNQDLHVVGYAISAENSNGVLHLARKLDINVLNLDTKYYSPIRAFFEIVKTGDEQPALLLISANTTAN